eukprot:NODE_1473_length_1322_cov_63.228452_g1460_i0.p1 GENE.NODE_1473_length_1322_cov_63.228452_g1460_i0~~NODE_1473_length_1322_cov_63.228452_g1460_i0.p1  ORF type:complete len:433 (+),score=126.37 NODE_1473_length_1322_cov_63.228452_g1460_i0:91-1299(+)
MENSTLNDGKNYYLEYTIGYLPITAPHVPLTIFWLDTTATHTYDCQIEHQIPGLNPGEKNVITALADIPQDWGINFMVPHQHVGGASLSVDHYRNGTLVKNLCDSHPTYGSDGSTPGNESGYVVGIPTCTWDTLYNVSEGDQLKLTSTYEDIHLPGGHNWHSGVMSLVYMAAYAGGKSPREVCLDKMHDICGSPPYPTYDSCIDCVMKNGEELAGNGCTEDMVVSECNKNGGGGNVPSPDNIDDMSLSVAVENGVTTLQFTGPAEAWFSVAFCADCEIMDGATAYVYTSSGGSDPKMVIQERILGNHYAGNLTNADFPVESMTTTEDDKTVAVVLNTTALHSGSKNCWLFAHGSGVSGHLLQYHGSARGTTCGLWPTEGGRVKFTKEVVADKWPRKWPPLRK